MLLSEMPAARAEIPTQQRARGALHIRTGLTEARTRVADLYQHGCLRACFPRADGLAMQAVLLNSSGGVADGDALHTRLTIGPGSSLVAATQAAERIYRARSGAAAACITVQADVAAGGTLEYLPQGTILFNASALDRRLHVDLAGDAAFLGVETLVFGRAASGEILHDVWLRDTVTLRRDGRLRLHDSVLLRGPRSLAGRAGADGAGAVCTVIHAAPGAASALDAVRHVLAGCGVRAGASFRDGVLVARIVAPDSRAVRGPMVATLAVLRDGRALPRVWSC
jgi:urease accessory protein